MHRTLIVARMTPGSAEHVAEAFAESDGTELPHLVGVTGRTLFSFHDLYVHLIESRRDPAEAIAAVREHPLFVDVNNRLSRHITAYHPSWRGPADAMAQPFYQWTAQ